ncbi:isoamylase early set domain-containing protein [Treponema brennaborense]|uniref:Glycoside hydrolase family 13 domain protein n=1 Tax=Treponema brennaborense (strain DSM 12168 / CIP 105900 / DD5/3) TaxID=906968 RepID=F4LN10_TREBD|nr:isoamylase early set domain-containing protein [Treponema brennaborense]AEE15796.1 glycoside hydrolase family 13 domain protein [Treponema brennaborense DSM 12168]
MALYKTYMKTQKICKVKFELSAEAAAGAERVWLAGDFNSWSSVDTPMKKQKDGSFSVTVPLETGCEYQFRYLLDGKRWENDWAADKYVPAPFSNTDNSVVIV